MPVLCSWNITIEIDELLRGSGMRDKPRPAIRRAYREAVRIANTLNEPRAVHGCFPLAHIGDNTLELCNGTTLTSEELAAHMRGVDKLIVMGWTIGPKLESAATEQMNEGSQILGYGLDLCGSLLTEKLGRALYETLSADVSEEETKTSPMAPGQLDWDPGAQRDILQLIPAEAIGMSLTQSAVLRPKKSGTAVFGVGKRGEVQSNATPCDKCPRREQCNHRWHIH